MTDNLLFNSLKTKKFSTSFPFRNRKKSFQRFSLSKSKGKVFEGLFVFEDKKFSSLSSPKKVERKSFRRSHHWQKSFDVVFILEVEKRSTLKTLTKKLYWRFRRSTCDKKISEERQSLRGQTSINNNINSVNGTKFQLLHLKSHKIVGTICNNNNVFIFEKPKVNCVTRFV